MNISNVTSVHDDDGSKTTHKLTANFKQANQKKQNRNHFQCYHNNKGYCKYRSECHFQHYKETCLKTVCKDLECKYRQPKICRHKWNGKFNKKNICFFKHEKLNAKVTNELEALEEEVNNLREEISDLKKEIETKQNVLEEETAKVVLETNTTEDLTKQNEELNST